MGTLVDQARQQSMDEIEPGDENRVFYKLSVPKKVTVMLGGPLMNLALFSHRQFAMGSIVSIIYGTALFGSTYLLPVYLQMGLGLSASHVGAMLLPAGFVLAITIAIDPPRRFSRTFR